MLKKHKFRQKRWRSIASWGLALVVAVAVIFYGPGTLLLRFNTKNVQAATETKYATSHITGSFTNPNNAIGATDTVWAGQLNTSTDQTSRWAMDDPSGAIAGTQTIDVWAKKGSNSGTPTIALNLYENGTLVQSIVGNTNVTSTTGANVSGTFSAAAISNPNNVEIEVVMTAAGGSPSARNSAQIDSIKWTVNLAIAISQAAFGFYEDGTESGASIIGSQDTNITRNLCSGDSNLALRLRLQETAGSSGASTDDYQLTYSKNGGAYAGVNNWVQIGNSMPLTALSPALAALSSSRVAFLDVNAQQLRTYDFDGTNWSQTGNSTSSLSNGAPALAALSSSRVAFVDAANDQLRTYDFDGTNWSQTGNSTSSLSNSTPALAALSSSRVAFIDASNDQLRTYDFDGTNWSQVGNNLPLSNSAPALAALTSTRVAFIDATGQQLRTYDFDGTNWSQTGNSLTIPSGSPALAALTSTRVAFIDSIQHVLRSYTFDGTNWSQVGTLTLSDSGTPALAGLSSSRVAFIDDSNDQLRVYDAPGIEVTRYLSTNLTDSATTTNRLTSGSGSFVAGKISEDGLVDNLQITASNYTELLYSLTLKADELADGDTLDFRVTTNGSGTMSYPGSPPRITISKSGSAPSTDQLLRGGTYFSGGTKQPFYWGPQAAGGC